MHIGGHARANGVLISPLGNTVHVLPPYCITHHQRTRVYATVRESLERTGHAQARIRDAAEQ